MSTFQGSASKMLTSMRKSVIELQSKAGGGHTELNVAIFTQKCCAEAVEKMVTAKRDAADAWRKWAEKESDEPIKTMFDNLADLDDIWMQLYQQHADQIDSCRKTYKEILKGDLALDEMRKEADIAAKKTNKCRKQIDTLTKTKEFKKMEPAAKELEALLAQEENLKSNLQNNERSHKQFKFIKIREAATIQLDSESQLHGSCQQVALVYQQVLNIFTSGSYEQANNMDLDRANYEAKQIIIQTAKDLKLKTSTSSTSQQSVTEGIDGASANQQNTRINIPHERPPPYEEVHGNAGDGAMSDQAVYEDFEITKHKTGIRQEKASHYQPKTSSQNNETDEVYMTPDQTNHPNQRYDNSHNYIPLQSQTEEQEEPVYLEMAGSRRNNQDKSSAGGKS